jgi:hypothetical protein
MSTVRTEAALAMSSTHRRAVAWFIISVRNGELSTWQWLHAWNEHEYIKRRTRESQVMFGLCHSVYATLKQRIFLLALPWQAEAELRLQQRQRTRRHWAAHGKHDTGQVSNAPGCSTARC